MISKPISRIGFSFKGCIGKERKPKLQIVLIERIDGHQKLTDEQKELYFEKARTMIKEQKMKVDGFNLVLRVNHAEIDDLFESVNLIPVQTVLFSKAGV